MWIARDRDGCLYLSWDDEPIEVELKIKTK